MINEPEQLLNFSKSFSKLETCSKTSKTKHETDMLVIFFGVGHFILLGVLQVHVK
jgi:hypothetical protein